MNDEASLPPSTDRPELWDAADDVFGDLETEIEQAHFLGDPHSTEPIEKFLRTAERYVQDKTEVDYTTQVYIKVAQAQLAFQIDGDGKGTECEECRSIWWQWLKNEVRRVSQSEAAGELCIAAFEPMIEECDTATGEWRYSDIDANVIGLMRFLKDPETAWMVFLTFEDVPEPEAFPDNLREMFAKYQEYVGPDSPEDNFEFPEESLAAWIQYCEADGEAK